MKRLNSRVDAIEAAAGSDGTLSPQEKTMLVTILAKRDSLFWPWRWAHNCHPPIPELRARQRNYLNGTAGVSARADGRSQWKSSHEIRQRLAAAGMLLAVGANGETVSVILTPKGESVARALVGDRLATNADAWIGLAFLRVLSEPPGSPVRESVLFGGTECTGDPSGWEHRVERILPLLTSGVARADSDTCGRVLFTLTGRELPEAITVTVDPEDGFDEIYIRAFNNERNVLANVEPRDPAEIFIPISASLYWPKTEETTDEE